MFRSVGLWIGVVYGLRPDKPVTAVTAVFVLQQTFRTALWAAKRELDPAFMTELLSGRVVSLALGTIH